MSNQTYPALPNLALYILARHLYQYYTQVCWTDIPITSSAPSLYSRLSPHLYSSTCFKSMADKKSGSSEAKKPPAQPDIEVNVKILLDMAKYTLLLSPALDENDPILTPDSLHKTALQKLRPSKRLEGHLRNRR